TLAVGDFGPRTARTSSKTDAGRTSIVSVVMEPAWHGPGGRRRALRRTRPACARADHVALWSHGGRTGDRDLSARLRRRTAGPRGRAVPRHGVRAAGHRRVPAARGAGERRRRLGTAECADRMAGRGRGELGSVPGGVIRGAFPPWCVPSGAEGGAVACRGRRTAAGRI